MNIVQIKKMMQEAQKMQGNIEKEQKKLEKKEYTKTLGGDAIKITMLGTKKIKSIEIKPEILEPEEQEFIQEMIMEGINSLNDEIEKEYEEKIGSLTKGLPF